MLAGVSTRGRVFKISTVSDIVSDPPYASLTVNVATIEEPTGRVLLSVNVLPVPSMIPLSSVQLKSTVNVSASISEMLWIISSVTFASTLVEGEMLNASILGAVFSMTTDVVVSTEAPFPSIVEAVQTTVSVGLFSAGLMV